ncbi:hypothetical protein C2845_PM12G05700 [Panicum miliaceum]|uniref:Uncharacterized protein n=1 Tax=Panicum miliaceum TaxID=4540 RepID=A0A3L6QGE2_PANMI|nr:hypothetical protein C2845_PM12G05700 [Panicum miliaceum]
MTVEAEEQTTIEQTDLKLTVKRGYISSYGVWFMDGECRLQPALRPPCCAFMDSVVDFCFSPWEQDHWTSRQRRSGRSVGVEAEEEQTTIELTGATDRACCVRCSRCSQTHGFERPMGSNRYGWIRSEGKPLFHMCCKMEMKKKISKLRKGEEIRIRNSRMKDYILKGLRIGCQKE